MKRDSMVFYRGFYEALKDLPAEEFKEAAIAIMAYGIDGEEVTSAGIAKFAYEMAKPQIDANNQRYENGKKGGRPKTEIKPNNNLIVTKEEPNPEKVKPNVNVNVNDNVNDNDNKKRFTKPTVEEIRDYCKERNNGIDADSFYDFYESKGWRVGNTAMKDWRACVRTWERRNKGAPEEPKQMGAVVGLEGWL